MKPVSRLSKQSVETADVLDRDQICCKRGGGKVGRMLLVEVSISVAHGGSMFSSALMVIYRIFSLLRDLNTPPELSGWTCLLLLSTAFGINGYCPPEDESPEGEITSASGKRSKEGSEDAVRSPQSGNSMYLGVVCSKVLV